MKVTTSCPDRDSLELLLEKGGVPDEIDRLAAHLESCSRCGETVEAVFAADPTAAVLRGAKLEADGSSIQFLRARLAQLRSAGGAPASPDATTADNVSDLAPPPAAAFEATQALSVSLASPEQPDEIGRLGGYRVLKEVGRSGMGVVFLAEDVKLKRLVALKAMLPKVAADAPSRQRFLREAQAMAAVHHDHIVIIFHVDEAAGVPFLAMELLEGMPLDRWLKDGRKPTVAQVLRLGREIADGLAAAHERGLIHRDVKPGNIWLDSAHQGRVKILDFGLARAGTEDVHLTRSGAIVGTPAYMSPEQARGEKVDSRSDLFSLGCVLYRLCTGAMPFNGDTTMSLLMALAVDRPRPVREINADVPPELSDLVMKLLEKDPARRPASAREVVRAIQALERKLAHPKAADDATVALTTTTTPPPAAAKSAGAPRRRRWLPLVVAAAVVLAGLIGPGAAALIRIQTPQGDYVIDTDDPDFFFQVHDDAVVLQDRKNNKTYRLKVVKEDKGAGQYDVEVSDGGDLVFKTKTFTIKRGEKAGLMAWFEPKGVASNPPPGEIYDAWLKQVAALPAEKQVEAVLAEMKKRNPGFDGKAWPSNEDGVVTSLRIVSDDVTDLSPVRALPGLKGLAVIGSAKGRLSDLSPLKDMKLTNLICKDTAVSDLSPLKGMPLTQLVLDGSKASDLSPLKDMPLANLSLRSTPVSDADLASLKGMKLGSLDCSDTSVTDLARLKGLPLLYLICDDTAVSDLSPLKGMPLVELDCRRTKVTDFSPLKGVPLKVISCDFKPERDAEILRSLKTLEQINGKTAADFWKGVDAKKDDRP